jgi:hypothetical protein
VPGTAATPSRWTGKFGTAGSRFCSACSNDGVGGTSVAASEVSPRGGELGVSSSVSDLIV